MTRKITIAIPAKLRFEIREALVKKGYTLREKSRWVSEAITSLLELENYKELVFYGDAMSSLDKRETFSVEQNVVDKLEKALLEIRATYPELEGLRSRIIRTAMVQGVLRA